VALLLDRAVAALLHVAVAGGADEPGLRIASVFGTGGALSFLPVSGCSGGFAAVTSSFGGAGVAFASFGWLFATIFSSAAPRATFCFSTLVLYSARSRALSGSSSWFGFAVSTTCIGRFTAGGGGGGGGGGVAGLSSGTGGGGFGSSGLGCGCSSSSFSGSIGFSFSAVFGSSIAIDTGTSPVALPSTHGDRSM
jgi:hypothetical protein